MSAAAGDPPSAIAQFGQVETTVYTTNVKRYDLHYPAPNVGDVSCWHCNLCGHDFIHYREVVLSSEVKKCFFLVSFIWSVHYKLDNG